MFESEEVPGVSGLDCRIEVGLRVTPVLSIDAELVVKCRGTIGGEVKPIRVFR